ncbi:nuclear pore complex protein NUP160 isoform X2 [Magnolia sinica]|uniref:nuclear pore complex protein NUP160 isoform X2 n=1 Tax=Magnolia sinica TaxID=86752 RepID=UPI00265A81BD|nr:nuclear pore complex protein NUP160 isoform X2 [Magnolia sinica]
MATRPLGAMEVPITGSDSIQWAEVTVTSSCPLSEPCAPLTENAASCHVIGDPSTYLIWRIHKNLPNALELVELSASKEFPKGGLRLTFQNALCPFAFICRNEVPSTADSKYLLYALTVSGVAYLFRLRAIGTYVSGSIFPQSELVEIDVHTHLQIGKITCVTATSGCLVIGQHDGSIFCFQLGLLDQSALGFIYELRDDVGRGRLWGLMSRGRIIGAVQGLIISEVHGRKLLFVLHVDGSLRVWDLRARTRLLTHNISLPESAGNLHGSVRSRLWVADANYDTSPIPLVILYRSTSEADGEMIGVYSLCFSLGEKITFSVEPSMQCIHLEEGRLIDLKITSGKLWILKEDGSMLYDLFQTDVNMKNTSSYGLQEPFVAEHLFQTSEHASDDLIWASCSAVSSMKDHFGQFVSSIFLRKLLLPGIHQNAALHATIHDHNKHLTESEFQSLSVSVDVLKKQILSIMENEGVVDPVSIIYYWKNFCTQYFHHWCQNSSPYGLLLDPSTGAVGLIRKNSISIFRCLEGIELLIYGSCDEFVSTGLVLLDDDVDRELLYEVLRCISSINCQLSKAAASVFYESIVSPSLIPSEDVIPQLLKILETGYKSSAIASNISQFGADAAWEKELADHKSQRKFSVDMLLSLHALRNKAMSWNRVLNVVEKYLNYLIPNKCLQSSDPRELFNINTSLLVQATSQVARVMVESAFDILMFLSYLVNISGQVLMVHEDISRVQLELIPMIQEILTQWIILHLVGTTPSESLSESPLLEDFSSRLSSLRIDNKMNKTSWVERLGTKDFTLACILLLSFPGSTEDQGCLSSSRFANPNNIISSVRNFSSWIISGRTGESPDFFHHTIELATVLFKHGQYEAVENLLVIIDAHSCKEKASQSIQSSDGVWCACLHLLGFCLLVRAHNGSHGILKESKIREAVRCFFRAASGQEASQALQRLFSQTGLPYPVDIGSAEAWKFHYYQWAMQIFEQYNMSEGACQFALAALEQVDEVIGLEDENHGGDLLLEPAITIRGRLWANVFKFTLDLNHYRDAYCAIITNPDQDSKHICLRRFIIVLCERGATKVLCDGELPFVGLMDKVEQELVWKAERSDITAKTNPYKILYAFEMYRQNWRRAASYMYQYSVRLRNELTSKEQLQLSSALQERLFALSSAINTLHLVHPSYAWIDAQHENYTCPEQRSPNKKARTIIEENSGDDLEALRPQHHIDIEKLENEYVLTSAQYLLALANVKPAFTGSQTLVADSVDLLVQADYYDMAFTVLLKFWKDSGLKRELERVFISISQKCCPNRVGSVLSGNYRSAHGLLLTSSEDETSVHGAIDMNPTAYQSKGINQWETLEHYLEKYRKLHPRLPVTVAETLLHTDPQIELPLWLVHMFKGGRKGATSWGMTGQEPDAAALFRLYVDYGRYTEATNLLLEYIESFASLRPADIINRKKMSAVWFPYTAIERLWCQLEELRSCGHMVDQCDKLKKLIHGALLNHLKQLKVDSDDALSSGLQ